MPRARCLRWFIIRRDGERSGGVDPGFRNLRLDRRGHDDTEHERRLGGRNQRRASPGRASPAEPAQAEPAEAVEDSPPIETGGPADALLTGEVATITGETLDLATLRGTDVVLWFWAPW